MHAFANTRMRTHTLNYYTVGVPFAPQEFAGTLHAENVHSSLRDEDALVACFLGGCEPD